MLPATLKLCCGISHQRLRKLTGLQRPAVNAFGKEMSNCILKKSESYFPSIPDSLQRLLFMKLGISTDPGLNKIEMPSGTDMFYLHQAEETLRTAMTILQQEGWQAEKNGDWILSKTFPKIGKVFRAEAVIDSPPEHIYTELFEKLEDMDQWNPDISKVQVLQRIRKNTLLTREVTNQLPVKMVSQRDFVSVRQCFQKGSSLYLVGTATHSQLMPPQKGMIRAEAKLTCIVLRPFQDDSRKTHFTWLLSLDLKGWIPKSVTDQILPQSQAAFISQLRRNLSSQKET